MEEYQERVVKEKCELDERLDKLSAFIVSPKFCGVDDNEKVRMIRQSAAMADYSRILGERIECF